MRPRHSARPLLRPATIRKVRPCPVTFTKVRRSLQPTAPAAPAELGPRRRGCSRLLRLARLIGVLAPRYNSSRNMGPLDRRALEVGYFLVLASVVVFLATPFEAASFGVPVMAGGVLL